jgi:hypothetical protein
MADDATTSTTTEPTEPKPQGEPADLGDGGKKALAEERAARKAAEKAHAELAAKLKAIEDRDLSELDKAKRDVQDALEAADQARREALRFRVAASSGISDEDAEIFLTGPDEESIKRQAERLVSLRTAAAAPGTPRPDPSQGATATPLPLNGDPIEKALRQKLGIT